MSTLLLRFAGPLQSWGINSKFEVRRTENEPSKSGVIGLIAAALGVRRDEDIGYLNQLRLGIRVDREGQLLKDFHTAHNEKSAYITNRYYLADAIFLVGLESEDEELLKKIEYALRHPAFPLFLGRRSCPPVAGLVVGIRQKVLEIALEQEPWQGKYGNKQDELRIVIENKKEDLNGGMVKDKPLSYNPEERKYGYRRITKKYVSFPSEKNPAILREHDVMKEL